MSSEWETLPNTRRLIPFLPRDPTMRRSHGHCSEHLIISDFGYPSRTSPSAASAAFTSRKRGMIWSMVLLADCSRFCPESGSENDVSTTFTTLISQGLGQGDLSVSSIAASECSE